MNAWKRGVVSSFVYRYSLSTFFTVPTMSVMSKDAERIDYFPPMERVPEVDPFYARPFFDDNESTRSKWYFFSLSQLYLDLKFAAFAASNCISSGAS